MASLDLHVFNFYLSVDAYAIAAPSLTSEAEGVVLGIWVAHDKRHDGLVQRSETVEDETNGAVLGVSGNGLDSETAVRLFSVDAEPVDAIIDFELHLGLKVADGLESAVRERLESQKLRSSKSVAGGTYDGHKSQSSVDVATHVLLAEADL